MATRKKAQSTSDANTEPCKQDDFATFVRTALTSMNGKLDNLIANQSAFEKRLGVFDTRISELTETAEFNASTILEHKQTTSILEKALDDATRDLNAAKQSISELQDKTNVAERHSRGYNVRLLGIKEADGESCINVVETVLRDKFAIADGVIEFAHRTGKPTKDRPRHIIARFYSRDVRGDVMRAARKKLENTPLRLIDDLTREDMAAKQRVRPFMQELYEKNRRPSFRNGRLYAEGKLVSADEINAFLNRL